MATDSNIQNKLNVNTEKYQLVSLFNNKINLNLETRAGTENNMRT